MPSKALLNKARGDRPPQPYSGLRGSHDLTRWGQDAYIREGYNSNALIFAAAQKWGSAVKGAPLRPYSGDRIDQRVPADGLLAVRRGGAEVDLIAQPNPFQTWREIEDIRTRFYRILGNSFIYFQRGAPDYTTTVNVWCLPPQRMEILFDDNGIAGYRYTPYGAGADRSVIMVPDDVWHMKQPNLDDPHDGLGWGLSPLSVAALSGDVDNRLTEHLNGYIRDGMMPPGFFTYAGATVMDERTRTILEQQMSYYTTGFKNAQLPSIVPDDFEWVGVDSGTNDVVIEAVDKRSGNRILMSLDIPPMLLNVTWAMESGAKYNHYEQAYQQWWRDTVVPFLRDSEDAYTRYLIPRGVDADMRYDLSQVHALQAQTNAQISEAADVAHKTGTPLNAVLTAMGVNVSIEGGDVGYLNGFPVSRVGTDDTDASDELPAADEGPPADSRSLSWRDVAHRLTVAMDAKSDYVVELMSVFAEAESKGWGMDAVTRSLQTLDAAVRTWGLKNMTDFRRSINSAVRGAYTGELTRSSFVASLSAGIRRNYTRAWLAASGTEQVGNLTPEEVSRLEELIVRNTAYLGQFYDRITDRRDEDLSDAAVVALGDGYARMYRMVVEQARLYDNEDQRLRWELGSTEQHCRSCKGLNKRVYRASTWAANNCAPRSQRLECGLGGHCDCRLRRTRSTITPGRFPTRLLTRRSATLPQPPAVMRFINAYHAAGKALALSGEIVHGILP